MSLRSLFLPLLLGNACFLHAQDFSAPTRPVPIREPETHPQSNGTFIWTLEDLTRQRNMLAGDQTGSAEQRFGVAFAPAKFDLMTLTYYSGADFFRQDAGIFDDLSESSRVMLSWINKLDLTIKLPSALSLDSYAQTGRSFADEQIGFADSLKYGEMLAWSPFKDVTKFQTGASLEEKRGFDETTLLEKVYSVSLEQKIPATPLTLRVADSWTGDSFELLPERDKDVQKIDAALIWKIIPEASWSAGLQAQDAAFDVLAISETTNTVFTEFTVQSVELVSMTLRAGHEEKTRRDEVKLLSNDDAFLLGLGLNLKLADRLNAGFGVQYRIPQSPPAATPTTPNLPAFSVSASAKF